MRLLHVWLWHVAAALATVVVIAWLVALSESLTNGRSVLSEFMTIWGEAGDELVRSPVAAPVITLSLAALIELAFLGFALAATPWGARDEPLRASYKNALRQAWRVTATVIPLVIVVGTATISLELLDRRWRATHTSPAWATIPPYPTMPQKPKSDPTAKQAWVDFETALQAYTRQVGLYQQAMGNWRAKQPWYQRNYESLIVLFVFTSAVFLLAVYLRSVGAERGDPPHDRPPTCEACGYNLMTIPLDSRCPECGEPVAMSLGPAARSGTDWQQRHEIGRFKAWRTCARRAFFNPRGFGRQLRMRSVGSDHRRFFVLHLPIVSLIGAAGIFGAAITGGAAEDFARDLTIPILIMTIFGIACAAGATSFILQVTLLVALRERFQTGRNLLAGAMQMACYLAPYLTAWAAFGAASGILMISLDRARVFHVLEDLTGVYHDSLAVTAWLIPNAACGIWFLAVVGRGTEATRYANR